MVRAENAVTPLEKALMHPTRLAVLLVLATAAGPVFLSELEEALGVPRQTLHSHLELLVREGVVEKMRVFADRPRVVYTINRKRVEELLEALGRLRKSLEQLERLLEDG